MKGNSFFYCLGQGFKGIKRNKVFFLASVATIAACVFMVGILLAVMMNINFVLKEAQDSVSITVFFDEDLNENEIQEIGKRIEGWDEVSHIEYTSAEDAWATFKESYFKDNPELAEGFAGDNPLANSASYAVYFNEIEDQSTIADRLSSLTGVRKVNQSEVTANALSDVGKIVGIISLVIGVVLFLVSVFLISNTITTGITMRSEEIKIMKYVGATDFFVKSPFVFEGVIIGLIGAIIPLIILFFVYRSALTYIMSQFNTITDAFSLMPASQIFALLIPVALILGAGIGIIGSSIATNKYIKV
ncbi:MAG: permease-like cell division protein FtsX [Lachnospiraceae bacterium]|nr:permease-like cell division protein FtsX [Lachnospiraceae bacterium]